MAAYAKEDVCKSRGKLGGEANWNQISEITQRIVKLENVSKILYVLRHYHFSVNMYALGGITIAKICLKDYHTNTH